MALKTEEVDICWFTMTLEDVAQRWMLTNAYAWMQNTAVPKQLESTKVTVAEEKYVHVHSRWQKIEHPSDRICTDCFMVKDKKQAYLLVDQLKEQHVCWIRDRAHSTLPLKVVTTSSASTKMPTKIRSHDFVYLQLPQLVFTTRPRDLLEVRHLSDPDFTCRCVASSRSRSVH